MQKKSRYLTIKGRKERASEITFNFLLEENDIDVFLYKEIKYAKNNKVEAITAVNLFQPQQPELCIGW